MVSENRFIRVVDSIGRIVLPAELRESLDIGTHDKLVITADEKGILISKES